MGFTNTNEYPGILLAMFFGLFTMIFALRIYRSLGRMANSLLVGNSELKIEGNTILTTGMLIKGRIVNPRITDESLKVTLRNIEETFIDVEKDGDSRRSYYNVVHSEVTGIADQNTLHEFAFVLPIPKVGLPSLPAVHRPIYWELDCEGVDSKYRAVFRIEVK